MWLFAEKLENERMVDGFEWVVVDNRGHLVASMAGKGNSPAAKIVAENLMAGLQYVTIQ